MESVASQLAWPQEMEFTSMGHGILCWPPLLRNMRCSPCHGIALMGTWSTVSFCTSLFSTLPGCGVQCRESVSYNFQSYSCLHSGLSRSWICSSVAAKRKVIPQSSFPNSSSPEAENIPISLLSCADPDALCQCSWHTLPLFSASSMSFLFANRISSLWSVSKSAR